MPRPERYLGSYGRNLEEEFHRAHEIWQKHRTLPVLFYFSQKSFPPPRTAEELEHLGKVSAFCNERSTKGRVAE